MRDSLRDIVRDVTVVVLGGGRGARLDPLTRLRSKPAVPIAGKYRLIDIPISNALHSGMQRAFVLTQFNSVSLHRHIVQTYKFDAFSRGFVQILAAQQTPYGDKWFQGTADAVRQNISLITELQGDHVLILSGDHMYRMDFSKMLEDHLAADADLTLAVLPCSTEEISGYGAVRVDATGRIVEFREKPKTNAEQAGMEIDEQLAERYGIPSERPYLASMGIYLFNKRVLVESLDNELSDFGYHVIPAEAARRRVQAHFFDGYWRDIGTIRSFYETHMDIVLRNPPFSFTDPEWPIYTQPLYLPGSRLDRCQFVRTMLSEGNEIDGAELRDSIIGVRSRISQAKVRRSVVMGADPYPPDMGPTAPPVGIGPGSVIDGAIIDKNARIGRDVKLVNMNRVLEAEGAGWAIRDGIVVVAKNAVIPDGTEV